MGYGMKQLQIENETLRVVICPKTGGKILSFYEKKHAFELAAQSGRGRKLPKAGEEPDFGDYAYGMDDAFPNINGELYEWNGKKLDYPDHGEIWKMPLEVVHCDAKSVKLHGKGRNFAYEYDKRLELLGDSLILSYRIINTGIEEFPCFWTWHGLIRYEEDAILQFPEGTKEFRNVLDSDRLGKCDTVYQAELSSMHKRSESKVRDTVSKEKESAFHYDFTSLPERDSISWEKYYIEGRVSEGRCGMLYPSQGMRMLLEYDAGMLPYLGFWVTAGRLLGDYNCALEPTNGFYDAVSIAETNGALPILKADGEWSFSLRISLKALKSQCI
ncbi:MAG: DUF5107 domain-containing protein [Lachnospiraceae bacterium]|nr:DUF5107 domain-containing protein [Lachnospiraceae bacterium]